MLYRLLRGHVSFKLYVAVTLTFVVLSTSAYIILLQLKDYYPVSVSTATPHSVRVRRLPKLVTVVFRQFEEFENDVADSVQSFVSAYPNMPVLVVCESPPYPPFPFAGTNETLRNVKLMSLQFRLDAAPREFNPLSYIATEFTLFVPDSTRVVRKVLQEAAMALTESPTHAIAIPVGSTPVICQQVKFNFVEWTLQYSRAPPKALCDAVNGQHAILIRTSMLQKLPLPFMMPFPESLYLQTTLQNIKIQLQEGRFGAGRSILKSPTGRQKCQRRLREQKIALYKQLGVKTVMREDGRRQWFGCKRETQRCFPAVQGVPSFILMGRNTPPCCRRNMRRVATHVLKMLLQDGARCWLETTSLLGAVTIGDILPYAEYAEIGIHAADLSRVSWLQRGGADPDGFVWERATKGHYYRVAYSSSNRVYALVLPFTPRNGSMWPADWVLQHQRDFPERHLHPLAQIQFMGDKAPSPNDARAFLDLKLGSNSVERSAKLGPKLLYP